MFYFLKRKNIYIYYITLREEDEKINKNNFFF